MKPWTPELPTTEGSSGWFEVVSTLEHSISNPEHEVLALSQYFQSIKNNSIFALNLTVLVLESSPRNIIQTPEQKFRIYAEVRKNLGHAPSYLFFKVIKIRIPKIIWIEPYGPIKG